MLHLNLEFSYKFESEKDEYSHTLLMELNPIVDDDSHSAYLSFIKKPLVDNANEEEVAFIALNISELVLLRDAITASINTYKEYQENIDLVTR